MPLIDCYECGQPKSDTAKTCPHCGAKKPSAWEQNNRAPQTTPTPVAGVLRRVAAVVLGLVSAFVLWFLAGGLMAFADIYGNTHELGGIAAVLGLIAAGFGAMSAALWKRPTSGKLVATVFVSILAVAAFIFGVI